MAKLQAILRALALDFSSLAELGAEIKEIFHRDSLPNSSASLVYFEIYMQNKNSVDVPTLEKVLCDYDAL